MNLESGTTSETVGSIEVIEDILPLYDINFELMTNKKIESVVLRPQDTSIEHILEDKILKFKVKQLFCHQMVEIKYV